MTHTYRTHSTHRKIILVSMQVRTSHFISPTQYYNTLALGYNGRRDPTLTELNLDSMLYKLLTH